MEQTKTAKISCVKGVMRRMCRESSRHAHTPMSSAMHTPVAARYWLKSRWSVSAIVKSLIVIAVMGPVGLRTSSGWQPRRDWQGARNAHGWADPCIGASWKLSTAIGSISPAHVGHTSDRVHQQVLGQAYPLVGLLLHEGTERDGAEERREEHKQPRGQRLGPIN